jgi:PAS domain S-box-containing protein
LTSSSSQQIAACLRLGRAIGRVREAEEVYALALDALDEGLGVTRASILLFDEAGVMRFCASRGLSDAYRRAVEGHTPWTATTVDPVSIIVPDVATDPALAALLPALRAEHIAALAFIPLVSLGRVIGKLTLYYDTPREIPDDELQLAGLMASQVAFAIDRLRVDEHSQRLAAIVASSGDAIVSKSLEGIIQSWNHAAEELFGYTAAEAIGRSITMIIPPALLDEEQTVLSRIRSGGRISMETVRQRKDGSLVPIALTVSPVRNAEGRVIGASKIARDIGVRKHNEAERAELHRRLNMLVEASATLLTTLETESVLATTIALARQLLGADGNAVWEKNQDGLWRVTSSEGLSTAFTKEVVEIPTAIEPVLATLAVSDTSVDPHVDHRRARLMEEGVRSMLACPMRPDAATLVFYFRTPHDFSESDLEAGQTLANLAAAAMTTAELYAELRTERNQTTRAYQRVNEANRVKDEFIATLSHELRTPLNAIFGYAQMLKMGLLDAEAQTQAVAVVMRNAQALRQIIDDVLDVSRIATGKVRLHVRAIDLADLLRNAGATVQPAADAKGVRLTMTLGEGPTRFAGDPDRLQQVVWNLLSNAVKFTSRGGHVELRLERLESAVQIVVSDDGQGIDPAFLPHVFQRFRQADSRFSRDHGGLGLGLAIARELTELHGGTINAASPGPGRGATMTVWLPLTTEEPEAPLPPAPVMITTPLTAARLPVRLDGARVLAVDDEEDALVLLRLVLESAGATVTTAPSARRALELLQESEFDAVIADLGMPGMDGLEFIRRVRQLSTPSNKVPAAALTAYTRSEDRAQALASGFQLHLAKPLNASDLVLAVRSLVG